VAEFERSTTVGVGADAAFAFLSDPEHLPQYVSAMALVDDVAVDGDPEAAPEREAREIAPEARLLADAATRRIEWGEPGAAYGGSMTVSPGTASTSGLTIRLRVRDDADQAAIERMLDQAVRNLQRLLSGR
jgi:hypothetical protein